MNAFDLRDIAIGDKVIQARPVVWDREMYGGDGTDKDGEMAVPTKLQTTCPHCGNFIEFSAEYISIACGNCHAGQFSLPEEEFPFVDPGEFVNPWAAVINVDKISDEEIDGVLDSLEAGDG